MKNYFYRTVLAISFLLLYGCGGTGSSFIKKNNRITDTKKPDITLIGNNPVVLDVGENFIDPGAIAIDNIDGNITTNIYITNDINTSLPGLYTIIYTVSDKAGNITQRTRNVIVQNHNSSHKYSRISITGSSITWGEGNLGEHSYVGEIEKFFRTEKATTILPDSLNTDVEIINDTMCYGGKIYKYSGIGTEISGVIKGNELSIAYAKERGNTGAAIIELYIDGSLYDTFSTTNTEPYYKSITRNFIGTGDKVAFDLGYIFTFNHHLTLNSQNIGVTLNSAGYASSWPTTNEVTCHPKTEPDPKLGYNTKI